MRCSAARHGGYAHSFCAIATRRFCKSSIASTWKASFSRSGALTWPGSRRTSPAIMSSTRPFNSNFLRASPLATKCSVYQEVRLELCFVVPWAVKLSRFKVRSFVSLFNSVAFVATLFLYKFDSFFCLKLFSFSIFLTCFFFFSNRNLKPNIHWLIKDGLVNHSNFSFFFRRLVHGTEIFGFQ